MAATLTIQNNLANNPLSLTLSPYMDPSEGKGLDPADPQFTTRVWSRSLLKTGATLALEQLQEKELTFPLHLGPVRGQAGAPQTQSGVMQLIQQINQVLETPGATVLWQPSGTSQPTTFDILSGQFEVEYSYWAENQLWTSGLLRIFTQPLGRTAAPRTYATASGVGPLLMISPYASSGALALGASTQAGVAGFGGQQQGASSGVFYWGSPSLAGDGPAQLQISYVGPLPNTATNAGCVPYAAVSLLPDQYYRPLITTQELTAPAVFLTQKTGTAVASQYLSKINTSGNWQGGLVTFPPIPKLAPAAPEPTIQWAGQHRLFAIARASGPGPSYMYAAGLTTSAATVTLQSALDWQLYDLGTFSIRPSQPPLSTVGVMLMVNGGSPGGASNGVVDLTALVMLPDNTTWFLNPPAIQGSQYGYPVGAVGAVGGIASAPYTNTLLIDDVLGDQFIYGGQSQTFAPSPIGMAASSARMTQFTRGLVPAPDPKNGLPIIAVLGVGQTTSPSMSIPNNIGTFSNGPVGASWSNPQNVAPLAQVSILERTRYVLS